MADALLAASDFLPNPTTVTTGGGGGLILHLARAERRVDDLCNGLDCGPGPRLTRLPEDAYRMDGSAASGEAVGLLRRLRFYDDVVNRAVRDRERVTELRLHLWGTDDAEKVTASTPSALADAQCHC